MGSENARLEAFYESNFERFNYTQATGSKPENDAIIVQLVVGF